jgi:hypothetical protein
VAAAAQAASFTYNPSLRFKLDSAQYDPTDRPGITAPIDGASGIRGKYGPNNEMLPDYLQSQILELARQKAREPQRARIEQIRGSRQARMFFKQHQNSWWDESTLNFRLPNDTGGFAWEGQSGTDQRHDNYVTNIFQAFGLTLIAALSQDVPEVILLPVSAQDELDVSTAEYGTDVITMIERNNYQRPQVQDQVHTLFCDPTCANYTRFVVDGQQFGYRNETQYQSVSAQVGEDVYICPNCGTETPAEENPEKCPSCGAPLSENNLSQASEMQVPQNSGTERIPNGQEVITSVGTLQLSIPIYADKQGEMPYLRWDLEVDRGKLKAVHPHVAKKIKGGVVLVSGEEYERVARMQLLHSSGHYSNAGGDVLMNLVTYSRVWLRSWAFDDIEDDKIREELKELFPDGCYAAFAGDVYCESRNESMDDHWTIMHTMPGVGEGNARAAMSTALVDIQKRVNILENLQHENYEYGIPPIYADAEAVDTTKINQQMSEPATYYPVTMRPNQPLAELFFQPDATQTDPTLEAKLEQLLGPIPQFICGAMPSVWGGNMEDQQTARAYETARLGALGRIGIFWARLVEFHAKTMALALKCAAKNRIDDIEIVEQDDTSKFASKVIPIDRIQGNVHVRFDAASEIPKQWGEQRAQVLQFIEMFGDSPQFGAALELPENLVFFKNTLGLPDLVFPGERERKKQQKEIALLLKSKPVGGAPDPATGQMGQPQSSIPIDELLDNHAVEFKTIMDWSSSDAGINARYSNPLGFMNVRLHAMAHQQAMQKNAQQQKGPSESMNFKDQPDMGKIQMAAQAGIQLTPQDLQQEEIKSTLKDVLKTAAKAKAAPPPGAVRGQQAA